MEEEEGLGPVPRLDDFIPLIAQHIHEEASHIRVVVDQQNSLSVSILSGSATPAGTSAFQAQRVHRTSVLSGSCHT
jgi:hypothetical protein